MNIKKTVKHFIEDNKLFDKNDKLLIGVSGGADSVVLLDILHQLGYDISIVHCNFHLRDEESMRDEKFVQKLSVKYDCVYRSIDFDTNQYAKENKISVEMAARELRYRWFEKKRTEENADYILVAHHMDDSIETVLLNLTRGTGIKGVLGISPKQGKIVRPLLSLTKEDIEKYIEDNHLEYVTDSTNLESIYKRNSMRLKVLPLLKKINPSVNKAINNFANRMNEVDKIYSSYISEHVSLLLKNNSININLLLNTLSPKTILYEILVKFGFSATTSENLFEILNSESGKIFYSNDYIALKDRDFIIIKDRTTNIMDNTIFEIDINQQTINRPIHLEFSKIVSLNNRDINRESSKKICYVDANKLEYPLQLRKWKKGDRFRPLGMQGSKKLSDYFSDNKYSIFEKENIWLLLSNEKIVWIVGERLDDRFKLTTETSDIIKLEYFINK